MLYGRLLATTLRDNLSALEEGDVEGAGVLYGILQEWFGVVGAVAASPAVQLESLPAARRQRAVLLYGDIRRSAASLMADMWFSLGNFT